MLEVLITALTNFAIYSLFVVIYTLVGAYQNINVWGATFDWKKYVNGLVKWLALGGAVVGTAVGAFLLLAQAEAQGIQLVDAQAVAPRVIFGVVIVASGVMLGKIIAKLSTTLGVDEEVLEKIQEQSLRTDPDKPLVLDLTKKPMEADDYIEAKLQSEKDETEEQVGGIGAVYRVPINSYSAFRSAVLGKGYDIDGFYGWQCWDGTALLWQQLGKSLITGNGLAIGCWDLNRERNRYGKFDLITNVNSLKKGDVVCMRPNHIGFFDGYDGANMRILGQNQGGRPTNPNGGSAFNITLIAKSAFAGAFRFKDWHKPAPKPAPKPPAKGSTSGFKVGDTVQFTKKVDTRGTKLNVSGNYTVMQINNGSIVVGRGGVVTARVLGSSLKKVASKPTPKPAPKPTPIKVGDYVKPTKLVSYSGQKLVSYHSKYRVSQLTGKRAVLTANGQVWSAMNVANLKKV